MDHVNYRQRISSKLGWRGGNGRTDYGGREFEQRWCNLCHKHTKSYQTCEASHGKGENSNDLDR